MLQFGKYERPASVAEAYELLRKGRSSRILGGGVWLRLQNRKIPTVIDLSACGLDRIERVEFETARPASEGDAWSVGAMVPLHGLECHEAFNDATCHVFERAVRDIVGVQMRNLATVGGSLFGRFGFSDVLTALLPLDCEVELVGAGRIPLAEFAASPYERDILVRLVVRMRDYRASFQCVRRSATDFPVLNVCAAEWGGAWRVAVGARPTRAVLVAGEALGLPAEFTTNELNAACERLSELPMGSNMRGSERYRRHLARELGRRAILEAAGKSERDVADDTRQRAAEDLEDEREARRGPERGAADARRADSGVRAARSEAHAARSDARAAAPVARHASGSHRRSERGGE